MPVPRGARALDTAHGCDRAGLAGPTQQQARAERRERGMNRRVGVYITE